MLYIHILLFLAGICSFETGLRAMNAELAEGSCLLRFKKTAKQRFLEALSTETFYLIRSLLDEQPELVNEADEGGSTLLHMLVTCYESGIRDRFYIEELFMMVLIKGGDLYATDKRGYTVFERVAAGDWKYNRLACLIEEATSYHSEHLVAKKMKETHNSYRYNDEEKKQDAYYSMPALSRDEQSYEKPLVKETQVVTQVVETVANASYELKTSGQLTIQERSFVDVLYANKSLIAGALGVVALVCYKFLPRAKQKQTIPAENRSSDDESGEEHEIREMRHHQEVL